MCENGFMNNTSCLIAELHKDGQLGVMRVIHSVNEQK